MLQCGNKCSDESGKENSMSTVNVSSSEPVSNAGAQKIDVLEAASVLYFKGVERFAELQKRSIDLAADQNAEIIDSWKKLASLMPGAPGVFLLDLVSSGFERCVETQKGAIDLLVEQGNAAAGLIKERTNSVSKATEEAVAMAKKTVEYSVAVQRKALDTSAEQAKAMIGDVKQHLGSVAIPDDAAVDSLHRGIDTYVDTQKEFLDIAAMPFVGAK
jgi:hypothetical protein